LQFFYSKAPEWPCLPREPIRPHLGGFIRDGSKEGPELNDVKIVVRPDAAAQVETKRLHRGDGIRDVGRGKTPRGKERDADGVTNASAQRPIVSAPGAAKLLDGEVRVAGIE